METANDILRKHFELAKLKYPDENWKEFDEVKIEQEFIEKAMKEYASQAVDRCAEMYVPDGNPKVFHEKILNVKNELM